MIDSAFPSSPRPEPNRLLAPAERLVPGRSASGALAIKASTVLKALALIGLLLLGALVYPFASALLFAAVLAGALYPSQERLARRLGGHPEGAATVLTLAVALLLVVPFTLLVVNLGSQVAEVLAYVRDALESRGLLAMAKDLPPPLREPAQRVLAFLPHRPGELEALAGSHGGDAAIAIGGVIAATSSAILQVCVMVIALFFLLVEGPALVAWVVRVAPLPDGQILEILDDFRNVSVAVLLSSLATAGVQALAALAGFLLAGVPRPFFFTFVTFIVAFIPVLGAASAVLAGSLLLFLTGHGSAALFLALWGVLVVGFVDNLVKPLLMRGRLEVHGALIFFALLGGLATFGPVGLVAGPLTLSFFLAVMRIAERERLGLSLERPLPSAG